MKISFGTIVGLQFATRGWAQDHGTEPHTEPATPNPPYFSQDNFPDRLEHQPGQIIARDQTRLLLAFKVRQTPASLQPFLDATGLALEEPSPKGSLHSERINNSNRHFWVRKDQPQDQHSSIDQGTLILLAQALGNTLDWVGPVYSHPGATGRSGHFCAPPHVLLLKFQGDIGNTLPPSVAQILKAAHLREVPRKSQFLTYHRYFELEVPESGTVFHFYRLVREGNVPFVEDAQLDTIPLIKTSAAVGPDPLYGSGNTGQWNLRHIHADTGWALSTGSTDVGIWVIDEGFDSIDRSTVDGRTIPHPDIRFAHKGIDLTTMQEINPDIWLADAVGWGHGTVCAGIAAATTNNGEGIAGVAGGLHPTEGCDIYPLFMIAPVESSQIANAFNFAAQVQSGQEPAGIKAPLRGSVISISHGVPWDKISGIALGWNASVIDVEINRAQAAGIVICASSGNDDRGDNAPVTPNLAGVTYPATNPFVMACGASNLLDTRVTNATAPDGTMWGSNYGSHLSVVAPGVAIPSTDLRDLLQPTGPPEVLGYVGGDYVGNFWGTSAAAPHVAGLAALLRSRHTLSAKQVRDIIEQTAMKTGVIAYDELSAKPNGRWNSRMGYGLIDVFHALNFADVMIKDHPTDDGSEPFPLPTPSYGFEQSDIVVRSVDDVINNANFDSWNNPNGKRLKEGQDNFLYVRVNNKGPNQARSVTVNVRLVSPSVMPAQYQQDWAASNDQNHRIPLRLSSLPFFSMAANTSEIVKFKVQASDIQWAKTHWGENSFVLASVKSDNDYAFETSLTTGPNLISRRNNLTIAPLSLVRSGSDATPPTAPTGLRVQ